MNWSQIRALFPAAEQYTYLNSAAAPPLSILAAREGKRYYDEMAEHGDVAWDGWLCQVEHIRESSRVLLMRMRATLPLHTAHRMG